MKYYIAYAIGLVLVIAVTILIYKGIGESNLPLWMKFLLLK